MPEPDGARAVIGAGLALLNQAWKVRWRRGSGGCGLTKALGRGKESDWEGCEKEVEEKARSVGHAELSQIEGVT